MIVYWIVAVCLILNLVNPRLLWYIDAWKYKDSKKEEPSSAYIILSRSISAIGTWRNACRSRGPLFSRL